MKITRRQLRQIIKEELSSVLTEAYRDPTARHRSELAYQKSHWLGAQRERSRKQLQRAFHKSSRVGARGEIGSQLSSMGDAEQDESIAFLIPDDPTTGQPGHEVWADLAMKEPDWDHHKGATGSRVPTRREAYLADLAWDVADGRIQMDEDKLEKLISQSKTFRDTLSGAYGEIRTQEDIEDAFGHER